MVAFTFQELQVPLVQLVMVWCDNISANALATNLIIHSRTKHINMDTHFFHKKIVSQYVKLRYIPLEDELADILTKLVTTNKFQLLCFKLNLAIPLDFSLRGCIGIIDKYHHNSILVLE